MLAGFQHTSKICEETFGSFHVAQREKRGFFLRYTSVKSKVVHIQTFVAASSPQTYEDEAAAALPYSCQTEKSRSCSVSGLHSRVCKVFDALRHSSCTHYALRKCARMYSPQHQARYVCVETHATLIGDSATFSTAVVSSHCSTYYAPQAGGSTVGKGRTLHLYRFQSV